MIRHVFRKDLRVLWPLVLLVTAIQVAHEWAAWKTELMNAAGAWADLRRPLLIAWFVGIVGLAVVTVQEDPIPGVDQDWLVRPLPRTQFMLAKLAFVGVMVCAPMAMLDIAHALVVGFPPLETLALALYKAGFVFITLLLPVVALAAMARTFSELLALLAGILLAYALATVAFGALAPASRCPICGTSLEWMQHVLQHLEVALGAVLIIVCQYYRRLTRTSRWIAVAGMVAYVGVQLPWSEAWRLQQRVDGVADASGVQLELLPQAGSATGRRPSLPASATHAPARDLLSGNFAGALQDVRRRAAEPVVLRIPVRPQGVSADAFLQVDRMQFTLADGAGRVLYEGRNRSPDPLPLLAASSPGGHVEQPLEVPQDVYADASGAPVTLSVRYWLTQMSPVVSYRIAADHGQLGAPELGFCESGVTETAVRVRCRKTGNPPTCFLATLYELSGAHNPPFLRCADDYRPYIPAPSSIVLLSGVDLLTHDPSGVGHYPVDAAKPATLYVQLQVYRITAHLERTYQLPAFMLPQ